MKSYIITITDNKLSMSKAVECQNSALKYGYKPQIFKATTPKDNPISIFEKEKLSTKKFKDQYSKLEPALSCFLSHRNVWKKCIETNEHTLVLEHDATFKNYIPPSVKKYDFVNVGKPSFGKYKKPDTIGIYELFSKVGGYMPGAHGYIISPAGANLLLEHSYKDPAPSDLFLNKTNFPWMMECYPWPIEAEDTFTTIQNETGCKAKHNYNDQYKII